MTVWHREVIPRETMAINQFPDGMNPTEEIWFVR